MEWYYEYGWLTLPITALLIIGIIDFILKQFRLGIKKLFRSIRLIKFPNNAVKNIFNALLVIFFGWLAVETGGDMYSFNEVLSALIFSIVAFLIVVFADWKGMD